MDTTIAIPADVARKLGYYVYVLVNPLDGKIFYVGKGKGRRALAHSHDTRQSRKTETFRQKTVRRISAAGLTHRIDILAHGLDSEEAAYRIEAAVIDLLGMPVLTNLVRGKGTRSLGRLSLSDLVALYRKRPVEIREPAILIRINELYRPGMTPMELYDATRGIWKVAPRRSRAKYAFAVFAGVIREVYLIEQWLPAGSTLSSPSPEDLRDPKRWEFVGRLAPEQLRKRYVDRYVGHTFRQGSQNPIKYVNID
jgi:hypothetical protein